MKRLESVGLQVDVKKSEFIVQETKFLEVIIKANSFRIDPEKIAAIINWNISTNIKQVLMMMIYYTPVLA